MMSDSMEAPMIDITDILWGMTPHDQSPAWPILAGQPLPSESRRRFLA
jgi:hypothetical protein